MPNKENKNMFLMNKCQIYAVVSFSPWSN